MTHGFAADLTDAGARAVNAGVDMEMAMGDAAYSRLPEAVESGVVSEATLDASVRRVLEAKLRLGLFDEPYVDEERAREVLGDPAHRDVARIAAERSAVLLRNEGDLLPLDAATLGTIAVIGPLADSKRDTLGPWCFDFDLDETVTVLDGIRRKVGDGARVEYAPGVRPAQRFFASMFDMFGGNAPEDPEGFDDEAELERAVELARGRRRRGGGGRRMAEHDRRGGVALVAGAARPPAGAAAGRRGDRHAGRAARHERPAARPAVGGGPRAGDPRHLVPRHAGRHRRREPAVRRRRRPGGKLPFTWPRTVGQVPMIYSHTRSHEPENQARRYWDEESTPLFPFGHGLSYTRFAYGELTVDRDAIAAGDTLTVSVNVTNAGPRQGDEVVQLYIHQRHGSASRPVRELKGFQRVALEAGETRTVRFALGPAELRYWNAASRDWVIDTATFDLWVGGDSTAELATTFEVTAA